METKAIYLGPTDEDNSQINIMYGINLKECGSQNVKLQSIKPVFTTKNLIFEINLWLKSIHVMYDHQIPFQYLSISTNEINRLFLKHTHSRIYRLNASENKSKYKLTSVKTCKCTHQEIVERWQDALKYSL